MRLYDIYRECKRNSKGRVARLATLLDLHRRAGVRDLDPDDLARAAVRHLQALPTDELIHTLAGHWDLVALGVALGATKVAEEADHA